MSGINQSHAPPGSDTLVSPSEDQPVQFADMANPQAAKTKQFHTANESLTRPKNHAPSIPPGSDTLTSLSEDRLFQFTDMANPQAAKTMQFHFANESLTRELGVYIDIDNIVLLPETANLNANDLFHVIENLAPHDQVVQVHMQPVEGNDFIRAAYANPVTANDHSEPLQINIYDDHGQLLESFFSKKAPLPWSQLTCGTAAYDIQRMVLDLRNNRQTCLHYRITPVKELDSRPETPPELTAKDIYAEYQAQITTAKQAALPGMLNDKQLLQQIISNQVGVQVEAQDVHTRFNQLVTKLHTIVQRYQDRAPITDPKWNSFITALREKVNLKNVESKRYKLRKIALALFERAKWLGNFVPLPFAYEMIEKMTDRLKESVIKHFKKQDKPAFENGHSLDKMDIATDHVLQDGLAKLVFMYWDCMHLMRDIQNSDIRLAKTDPTQANHLLIDMAKLERSREEARKLLGVIADFTQQMQNDIEKMPELTRHHVAAAISCVAAYS